MVSTGTVVESPHTRIAFERTSADTNGTLLSFEETDQVGPQRDTRSSRTPRDPHPRTG